MENQFLNAAFSRISGWMEPLVLFLESVKGLSSFVFLHVVNHAPSGRAGQDFTPLSLANLLDDQRGANKIPQSRKGARIYLMLAFSYNF